MNIYLSSSVLLLFCPSLLSSQQRTKTESRSVQNLSDVSSKLAQRVSSPTCSKACPKTSPNSRAGEVVTTRLLMGEAVRWHHRSCWYRKAWNILAIFAGSLPSSILLLPLSSISCPALVLGLLMMSFLKSGLTHCASLCATLPEHHVSTTTIIRGLPWWLSRQEPGCQFRRHKSHPRVGKIPWRRHRQPPPVFLPGQFHGQRSRGVTGHGVMQVRRDLGTEHACMHCHHCHLAHVEFMPDSV